MIRPYWPGLLAWALLAAIVAMALLVLHSSTFDALAIALIGGLLIRITLNPNHGDHDHDDA